MPLIQQRATATIVDSNAMRFLSKHDVPLEALRAQDEAALNELLIAQLPTSVEVAIQVASDTIEQRMDALARGSRASTPRWKARRDRRCHGCRTI